MSILSKIAGIKAGADALDTKGVSGILSDGSSGKTRLASIGKLAAVRLAKKSWEASGAAEISALNSTKNVASEMLDAKTKAREDSPDREDNRKSMPFSKTISATEKSRDLLSEKQERREASEDRGVTAAMAEDIRNIRLMMKGGATLTPRLLGGSTPQTGNAGGGILSTLSGGVSALAGGATALAGTKLGGKLLEVSKGALSKIPRGGALAKIGGFAAGGAGLASAAKVGAESLSKPTPSLVGKPSPGGITDVLPKAVGKEAIETGAKTAGKSLLKKIPLIGALAGLGFGAKRLFEGDVAGAGLEVASGLASSVPIAGTAASLGIDGYLAYRDEEKRAQLGLSGPGNENGPNQPLALQSKARFSPESSTPQSFDLFTTFLDLATKKDKGIYVRVSEDTFSRGEKTIEATPAASIPPPAPNNAGRVPSSFTPSEPVAKELSGSGFVPNSERMSSPRPYLGGGVTPAKRVDATALTYGGDGSARASTPFVGAAKPGKFQGFGDEVDSHISEASKKFGMDEKVLRGLVKMEAGWTGQMSPTGAIGTGQFIKPTWDSLAKTKEGQDIGMTKIGDRFRTSADPRYDKRVNTLATGLLAKQNADMLKKNGLEASGENLYMLHNIGPGAIDIMKGGEVSAATRLAIDQNGGKGMSPKQFVEFQKGRFNSHYAQANSESVLSASSKAGSASLASKPPTLSTPVVTAQQKQSNGLTGSQLMKEAASPPASAPIIVTGGAGRGAPRVSSAASGNSRPDIVVRNNESSIRRVSDDMISRTVT